MDDREVLPMTRTFAKILSRVLPTSDNARARGFMRDWSSPYCITSFHSLRT